MKFVLKIFLVKPTLFIDTQHQYDLVMFVVGLLHEIGIFVDMMEVYNLLVEDLILAKISRTGAGGERDRWRQGRAKLGAGRKRADGERGGRRGADG